MYMNFTVICKAVNELSKLVKIPQILEKNDTSSVEFNTNIGLLKEIPLLMVIPDFNSLTWV
jgi:hypothetical protein